jgi:hypothetical protein
MSAQLPPARRVEVARGLVQHQHVGSHGEHGGHGDTSALPEGQVVRCPVGDLCHADGCERLVHPLLQGRPAQAEVGRPEGDVVANRRHEQLVVGVLEDQPDPATYIGEVRAVHWHTATDTLPLPGDRMP